MYLKSLTLKGFKSFASKTTLFFEPGVTVIVGPNGSGKSNVSDAFLWVLGEQNPRTLRSSKMEDVIFAGSSTRPALGMAEVSLTFDNSQGVFPVDYSEVTITRRIFRSGESEYAINESPCRLTDVQELLLNTGAGKEMYSLIGQGKLETILNSRPDERRILIEEAAGLAKYKRRKEKALRKLASTERNLVRVKDILGEVKRQLKPLYEQARMSRKHKDLVKELRDLEITLIARQIEDLKRDWDTFQGRQKTVQGEIQKLLAKIGKEKGEEKRLEEAAVASQKKEELLKEQNYALSANGERLRGLISLMEEKESHIRADLERLGLSKERDGRAKKEYSQEMESLKEKLGLLGEEKLALQSAPEEGYSLTKRISGLEERLATIRMELKAVANQERPEEIKTPGVVGFLSEFISVPEEYERAVEAILGESLYFAVAESLSLVHQVLEEGKAFWILSGDSPDPTPNKESPPGARPLSDIIETDQKRKPLISLIFRNIFLVKDLQTAFGLAKNKTWKRATFVTPSGEVVSSFKVVCPKSTSLSLGRRRRIATLNEEKDSLEKELNNLLKKREELEMKQVKLASLLEQEPYLNERLSEIENKLGTEEISEEELDDTLLAFREKLEKIERLIRVVNRFLAALEKVLAGLGQSIEVEKITRESLREDLSFKKAEIARLQIELGKFERESHTEDIYKAQLEPEIDTLRKRLEKDFKISLAEAKNKCSAGESREVIEESMRRLRQQIEALGPINPIATEEYESIEERKVHLESQLNDLRKSQRFLAEIVKIMDKKMTETFLSVFERTNDAFGEFFAYLFPQGKAELVMTDPDDLLSTGIEIEAQPSGKKLKKLSLLSGGENALTAIALLFALFKINPAPFYILDEVDVALDDVNLERFVSLLQKFRGGAQFLIVTHQRRTMEMADVLYGVTMQPDGISKMISQRLREATASAADRQGANAG
ncbi:MAG: AAA family ATPase [Actinomycetota bacterium]